MSAAAHLIASDYVSLFPSKKLHIVAQSSPSNGVLLTAVSSKGKGGSAYLLHVKHSDVEQSEDGEVTQRLEADIPEPNFGPVYPVAASTARGPIAAQFCGFSSWFGFSASSSSMLNTSAAAKSFLDKYYGTVAEDCGVDLDVGKLLALYRENSVASINGTEYTGVPAIASFWTECGKRTCTKLARVDFSPSESNGVLVLVTGNNDDVAFTETFHIAVDASDYLYISNQVFVEDDSAGVVVASSSKDTPTKFRQSTAAAPEASPTPKRKSGSIATPNAKKASEGRPSAAKKSMSRAASTDLDSTPKGRKTASPAKVKTPASSAKKQTPAKKTPAKQSPSPKAKKTPAKKSPSTTPSKKTPVAKKSPRSKRSPSAKKATPSRSAKKSPSSKRSPSKK